MNRKTVEQYRLALFGRLVMGVSHEVDNHLSVVLGFAELLQVSGMEKKEVNAEGKILSAGEKIAAIIKEFSHYVRPHAPSAELFSWNGVLSNILSFSRYDLGRGNVTLVMPEMPGECRIRGDSRDFALAMLSLLFNGTEAMAGRGGRLSLGASLREGTWHLTVSDEGPGISPQVMPRIFEEGFTTKPEPVHSGMGLPVARHILSAMGGSLAVENLPSGGCLANVSVPAA